MTVLYLIFFLLSLVGLRLNGKALDEGGLTPLRFIYHTFFLGLHLFNALISICYVVSRLL